MNSWQLAKEKEITGARMSNSSKQIIISSNPSNFGKLYVCGIYKKTGIDGGWEGGRDSQPERETDRQTDIETE